MKPHPLLVPVVVFMAFGLSPLARGDGVGVWEVRIPPASTVAFIPEPISDGTPTSPPPPVEKPDFRIESTWVKRYHVVESPPMAGLPPTEGTITLRVHSVADPGLPDPPPPAPPPAPRSVHDPEVRERLAELAAEYRETRLAFVSATVYDRSRTLLTCYPNGGAKRAVTVWSNLDFNHFSGFGNFEAHDGDGERRKYALFMGIGNEDTERRRMFLARRGIEYDGPEIPDLPDDKPAFAIMTENPDSEGVALIEDLHALYRSEGIRMAELAAAREKAYEERKAFFLANPPKPKDATVRFWKREKSAANPEGGLP